MSAKIDATDYPDRLLTALEVSEILGISPNTLANWRWAGQGPRFVRFGRQTIRYPREAVEEFAQTQLVEREPADELSDSEIVKQIARLANRLARRQRQAGAAAGAEACNTGRNGVKP